MLLGFKRRFAPFVEGGSKTHTIRRKKRYPPKAGDTCHCYVDPRQKTMRLLGRFRCTAVQDITICLTGIPEEPLGVLIDSEPLSPDEVDQLFYRDGFRDLTRGPHQPMRQAAEFWANAEFPFHGDLVHWEFKDAARPASSATEKKSVAAEFQRLVPSARNAVFYDGTENA